jgi:hypothetical protein
VITSPLASKLELVEADPARLWMLDRGLGDIQTLRRSAPQCSTCGPSILLGAGLQSRTSSASVLERGFNSHCQLAGPGRREAGHWRCGDVRRWSQCVAVDDDDYRPVLVSKSHLKTRDETRQSPTCCLLDCLLDVHEIQRPGVEDHLAEGRLR